MVENSREENGCRRYSLHPHGAGKGSEAPEIKDTTKDTDPQFTSESKLKCDSWNERGFDIPSETTLRDEQQQRNYNDEERLGGPKVHFLLSETDHEDKQDGQIDQELKHRKDFDDTDEEANYNFKSNAYRSFNEGPHRTGQYQKSRRIQASPAKEEELPGIAPEDIDLMTNFFSLNNQIGRKDTKMHSYLEADRPLLVVDTGSYNEELEKCFQGRLFLRKLLNLEVYALSSS